MYDFTDTNEAPRYTPPLATTWRGVTLDSALQGRFRTLGLTGRELLSPDLQTTPVVGADGEWVTISKLPGRPLVVTSWVEPSAAAELMRLLGTGEGELAFSDEPYTWKAVLQEITGPPDGIYYRQGGLIQLKFLAPDPYKYGHMVRSDTVPAHYPLELRPERIELSVTTKTITPRIYTDRRTLSISGTYEPGTKITIDFRNLTIKAGARSIMEKLDIRSDFLEFYVRPGERVRSQAGDIVCEFRERRL